MPNGETAKLETENGRNGWDNHAKVSAFHRPRVPFRGAKDYVCVSLIKLLFSANEPAAPHVLIG